MKNFDLASLLSDAKRRVDPEAWKAICTGLSIASKVAGNKRYGISKSEMTCVNPEQERKHEGRRKKLIHNGYALVDDSFDVKLVREGIEDLYQQNLPATFILLFDETWELACQSKVVLELASHRKNVFNYDLLAWYIPPGSPGFSPHRDRQPENAPSTFHSDDQQAKFITNWIALSDATPENSCLYVIPKPNDPGYTAGDIDSVVDDIDCGDGKNFSGSANPLHRALSSKESFQHIRCLPRKAGQSILFTHRIIHWGSQGDPVDLETRHENEDDAGHITSETTTSPRIAISFVCSDPDYEAPLLVNHAKYFCTESNKDGSIAMPQFPPLHIRLLLVCAQLLIYYQRFNIDKAVIKACYDYCKLHEAELEETYRRKVFVEFVNAMKEQNEIKDKRVKVKSSNNANRVATDESNSNSKSICDTSVESNDGFCDDEGENEDDEDAVLEEMLNAEAGGYGDFEDDYDDLEQGDNDINEAEYGHDDDDGEDIDEGGFDLFGGKRKNEDEEVLVNKKAKTFIT